jgi:DNA-binding protein HU-beta
MNKTQLAEAISAKLGIKRQVVEHMLDAAFETITNAVASGDEVSIKGFGKFEMVERAARAGRNPHTGEPLAIAATNAPRFVAAKQFKEAVKG